MLENRNHFGHPTEIHLEKNNRGIQKVHEKNQWSPYELNGGNIMALAMDDFAVFAADTRLSRGYSILHRDTTKVHRLTHDTYILTAGMYADTINLWKILDE
jgi:20S proteasome subunit beta 6